MYFEMKLNLVKFGRSPTEGTYIVLKSFLKLFRLHHKFKNTVLVKSNYSNIIFVHICNKRLFGVAVGYNY